MALFYLEVIIKEPTEHLLHLKLGCRKFSTLNSDEVCVPFNPPPAITELKLAGYKKATSRDGEETD